METGSFPSENPLRSIRTRWAGDIPVLCGQRTKQGQGPRAEPGELRGTLIQCQSLVCERVWLEVMPKGRWGANSEGQARLGVGGHGHSRKRGPACLSPICPGEGASECACSRTGCLGTGIGLEPKEPSGTSHIDSLPTGGIFQVTS